MAIVHRATLTPSKLDLLQEWLPKQPWFVGSSALDLRRRGSFRFDDPDGEVGIETLVVESGGQAFQVPLTYRGSPLPAAELFLIGIMEHSVLGTRWVYDAPGDPAYVFALVSVVLTGQPQADQLAEVEGELKVIPESVHLESQGTTDARVPAIDSIATATGEEVTVVTAGGLELSLDRVLRPAEESPGRNVLTAVWAEQIQPVRLASFSFSE